MGDKDGGTPAFVQKLPKATPKDLQEFLSCTRDTYTFTKGKVTWLKPTDLMPPDAPGRDMIPDSAGVSLEFTDAGNGKITVSVSATTPVADLPVGGLTISVQDGGLHVDDRSGAADLDAAKGAVDDFVKDVNDQMKKNGKRLGKPELKGGNLTLTKDKLAMAVPADGPSHAGVPAGGPVPAGGSVDGGSGWKKAGAVVAVGVAAVGIGLVVKAKGSGSETSTPTVPVVSTAVPSSSTTSTAAPATTTTVAQAPTSAGGGQALALLGASEGYEHLGPGNSNLMLCVKVTPGVDGTYHVTVGDGPTGSVSGTGTVTDGKGVLKAPIKAYGTYDHVVITGPEDQPVEMNHLVLPPLQVTSTPLPCDPRSLP